MQMVLLSARSTLNKCSHQLTCMRLDAQSLVGSSQLRIPSHTTCRGRSQKMTNCWASKNNWAASSKSPLCMTTLFQKSSGIRIDLEYFPRQIHLGPECTPPATYTWEKWISTRRSFLIGKNSQGFRSSITISKSCAWWLRATSDRLKRRRSLEGELHKTWRRTQNMRNIKKKKPTR